MLQTVTPLPVPVTMFYSCQRTLQLIFNIELISAGNSRSQQFNSVRSSYSHKYL